MEYFIFWFQSGLAAIAWCFVLIIVFFLVGVLIAIPGWFKKKMCKHESFRENMACHGICNNCKKDLGFVGNLDRSKQSNW